MKILVNGQEAVLKQDASFEYVSENPLFTEAEDYTLEIPFPMDDCPQNIAIFGALHVKGVDISRVQYQCEIVCEAFSKVGILTITSVSDIEVKGQFLEGMSQQNFSSSLPNIYLTDMDFSAYDGQAGGWEDYVAGPDFGWDNIPVWDSNKEKIVPQQGRSYYGSTGSTAFSTYSRNIYLSKLIEIVGKVAGWTIDISALQAIPMFNNILVVNTRYLLNYQQYPARPLSSILPKWTVKEFLTELSLFFGCMFEMNDISKTITFKACSSITNKSTSTVGTTSLEVLDDFSVELQDAEGKDTSYRGNTKVKLPDDCNPDNINCCPYIFEDKRIPHVSITLEKFLDVIGAASSGDVFSVSGSHTDTQYGLYESVLYYITDLDRYAIVTDTYNHDIEETVDDVFVEDHKRLQRAEIINQFGGNTEGRELGIAPCPLEPQINDSATSQRYYQIPIVNIPDDIDEIVSTRVGYENLKPAKEYLSAGERDPENMVYDKLWIVLYEPNENGLWKVHTRNYEQHWYESWPKDAHGNNIEEDGKPLPGFYLGGFFEWEHALAPSDPTIQEIAALPTVDETKLYRFKFLAQTLPSPTNIFLIQGKKYACVRLTAHFTVLGMSELVEGEFYEITD